MQIAPEAVRRNAEIQALEDRITELAAHIHAATFRLLELIREYDERGGWVGPGLKSCAHWLNWKCGIDLGAAREKVRVAHALKDLPKISEAFRCGRVSYSKVRAMTRAATPANEDFLLQIATHGTASHVERVVRNYRKVKRIEALEKENLRHDLREFSWHVDDDGFWVFRGRLTPDAGERVVRALEAAMDADHAERESTSAETSDVPLTGPASEVVAARRADALARMAEGYLAGGEEKTATGGDRCTVNLHVDAETLQVDGEACNGRLEGAGNLSAETSRRLACDAALVRWIDGRDGEPLDVGRRTRTIPPAIRRALDRRDDGCRFPGCTARRFVDAHHVRHWADGGETKLDNLVTLCRHHHRLVHEGGFGVKMTADGEPEFTTPLGNPISQAPQTHFRGNVFALTAEHRRQGLEIDPDTPIPHWHGEPLDDDMAMDVLRELQARADERRQG